jgi:hypothetical protein
MFRFIRLCLGTLVRLLRARRSLLLENLALRQQLAGRKRRHEGPRLDLLEKLFWVAVRRFCSRWQQSLIVVTPETVERWPRAGFRMYWKLISKVRRPVGRRQTSKEIQELIFRMAVENATWGAPRIHGELLMLGFDVSVVEALPWLLLHYWDMDPAWLVSLATPGPQAELVNGLRWDKPLAMLTERPIQGWSDVRVLVAVIFR